MIRLIVNADDLGCGSARDRGIFAARDRGIVSSASILATGSSFRSAARSARETALPVGVHLNLSEGRPLTGAIPGLTGAAGDFPGKAALRRILQTGRFDACAVHREFLAQIEQVRDEGLVPDHLDTHQHCLLFPALTGIIADVAECSGLRALRLPLPAEAEDPPDGQPPASPLAEELALYRQLAPAARDTLRARGLWSPDGLWGMPLLNRLDAGSLAAVLDRIPPGTWELMTHPGLCAADDPFGGPAREVELAALTAPSARETVARLGIVLTSFGACACAC